MFLLPRGSGRPLGATRPASQHGGVCIALDSLAGQHAITDRLELIGYEARQVEFIRYDTLSNVPANPAMRLLLSILALVLAVQVGAQGDIDRTFLRRYNYGGMQGGALTTTEDGGFIATGQHEGNGSAGSCDIYVYKVDACGNRIWFRLFGTGESEGGRSIEATPDGGFIIGGHSSYGLLLKLDAEGQAEWYHHYPAVDWVFDAIPLMDGGYAAIGRQSGRPVVFKVDEEGLVLWSKRYEGFHEMPLSLSELPNGDMLFVANQAGVGRDVDVARVDAQELYG